MSAIEGQASPSAGQAGWSPWELAIHEVESEVADVCGHVHSLHGRLVGLVERVLGESLWSQHGVRSPEHWVCWQTGMSAAVARRLVAAARRRCELPVTLAALEAGELSLDQVSPIVELAPAWADEQLCALAKQCTVTQIRAAVRRYPFDEEGSEEAGSDASDGAEDSGVGSEPTAGPGADHVRWVQLDDGTWQLSARLGVDDGYVVDAALREVTDALFADLGRPPTGAETLVELAQRSLDSIDDRSRRDRYRVHVMLDEQRELVDPYGHSLPTWLRDLITCDTTMAVTWTRHGRPIAQGSTTDTIPPATRRYVLARDQQCRVPGCGARRRLDIHHIVHRANHGTNDPCNLVCLCPAHHRLHHRGRLGIHGNADQPGGLHFTDHRGREIATNQLIRPPTGPPPQPMGAYRHPLGERLHLQALHIHRPRPQH